MKKGNDRYLWSERKNVHAVCCEDNYFPKEKFKFFNSLFHWVYLVFSILLFSIANLFAVRYLWDVRNEDKCCVVTHRLVDIHVVWLVYLAFLSSHVLRAYCNFDQNKPSRLLYLGDAQITIVPRESTAEEVSFKWWRHRISSTDSNARTTY